MSRWCSNQLSYAPKPKSNIVAADKNHSRGAIQSEAIELHRQHVLRVGGLPPEVGQCQAFVDPIATLPLVRILSTQGCPFLGTNPFSDR
jgi:hypothetical protein